MTQVTTGLAPWADQHYDDALSELVLLLEAVLLEVFAVAIRRLSLDVWYHLVHPAAG